MKKLDQANIGRQAKWAAGAVGIVLAYFGVFALLMYPVLQATGTLA
jgi:hypothetical protein